MTPPDLGTVVLPLARASIATRLCLPGPQVPAADWLDEPGASFVTLHLAGRLRGCIGSIEPFRCLGEDVWANARAAAFHDPRFPALTVAEYPAIDLEVSVLSAQEPIECDDEADLLGQLRPGVDGLVLHTDCRKGTFLPQVWEQLPEPAEFVGRLKAKAGCQPRGWSPDWRFSRFTVGHCSERDPVP